MKKKHHINQLIEQGEGQQLDFKFEISDAAKIARSLVAFANTEGGKLLIGVKDNGAIAGVRSEEEFFMIENAATKFCRPELIFTSKEWNIKGKKVFEVSIPISQNLPHRAPDKDGKFKAFFRLKDENLLVSGVQMKVWRKQNSEQNISVTIEGNYKLLLEYLEEGQTISVIEFMELAAISRHLAEETLADLTALEVIKMTVDKIDPVFSRI